MEKLTRLFMLLFLSVSIVACSDDDDLPTNVGPDPELPNLVEAAQAGGLTVLLDAVNAVEGLGETLLNASNITVFAPTNDAFGAALEAFGASNLEELVAAIGGVDNLEIVLGYHVVPSVAFSGDIPEGDTTLNTLAGQEITVNKTGATVTVTDTDGNIAHVVTPDIEIENGVVHVINRVILPELEIEEEEELPTLVEAAEAAGLNILLQAVGAVDGLGAALLAQEAITVFAPTDEAFGDALEAFGAENLGELVEALGGIDELNAVLGIHVVPTVAFAGDLAEGDNVVPTLAEEELTVTRSGSSVTVTDPNGRTFNVIVADVAIENGVVHVIDGVLLTEQEEEEDLPNLVEAAQEAGLTILLDAVGAVDQLGETLLAQEAITVFAPTNDAFADALEAFNAENLEELVAELGGLDALGTVLGFHVVPVVAFANDLAEGANVVPTLSGQDLTVTRSGANVTVTDAAGNTASVIAADVAIENGVVHVIDAVLLPNLD